MRLFALLFIVYDPTFIVFHSIFSIGRHCLSHLTFLTFCSISFLHTHILLPCFTLRNSSEILEFFNSPRYLNVVGLVTLLLRMSVDINKPPPLLLLTASRFSPQSIDVVSDFASTYHKTIMFPELVTFLQTTGKRYSL
ncbi:hypothetical protein CW304_27870 [Bacillus sp. UFRGS-B20]|nr:hypothetical protein CW304_27870 [Bacillus sp. UFRGS-B20]